jgi:hypothetical protein
MILGIAGHETIDTVRKGFGEYGTVDPTMQKLDKQPGFDFCGRMLLRIKDMGGRTSIL